jgi:hypothetical protein
MVRGGVPSGATCESIYVMQAGPSGPCRHEFSALAGVSGRSHQALTHPPERAGASNIPAPAEPHSTRLLLHRVERCSTRCDATVALSRLRHLMKRARQPQVVIPKVPQPVVYGQTPLQPCRRLGVSASSTGGHRMYSRKSPARGSASTVCGADTAPVTQTLQVGETRNSSRGSNTSALKHGGKWHWQVLEGASPSKHLVAYRPFNARAATALHRPKPL